jgi:DNA-binding transcriptional MerR regulator
VQQAAALTGLSEHTLRCYERIGLIKPVPRQESSGHRRYGPDDLIKLETLACLRATGMTIDQMRGYFELGSVGGGSAALISKMGKVIPCSFRMPAESHAFMRGMRISSITRLGHTRSRTSKAFPPSEPSHPLNPLLRWWAYSRFLGKPTCQIVARREPVRKL